MKLRVQQSMYWLGINRDIENHVMSCDPCQGNGRSQQKEPMIPFEVPNKPWQRVGIDLFHCNKGWYVIVADYYSKYPWIQALAATASKDVISALKSCFAEYGIPENVITDTGSQFTNQEYQCKSNILFNRTNIFRDKTSFRQFLTWLLPGLKKMLILIISQH